MTSRATRLFVLAYMICALWMVVFAVAVARAVS